MHALPELLLKNNRAQELSQVICLEIDLNKIQLICLTLCFLALVVKEHHKSFELFVRFSSLNLYQIGGKSNKATAKSAKQFYQLFLST